MKNVGIMDRYIKGYEQEKKMSKWAAYRVSLCASGVACSKVPPEGSPHRTSGGLGLLCQLHTLIREHLGLCLLCWRTLARVNPINK